MNAYIIRQARAGDKPEEWRYWAEDGDSAKRTRDYSDEKGLAQELAGFSGIDDSELVPAVVIHGKTSRTVLKKGKIFQEVQADSNLIFRIARLIQEINSNRTE